MKKFLNKIKTSITALGIAVVSLFSKVIGQHIPLEQPMYGVEWPEDPGPGQPMYGVEDPEILAQPIGGGTPINMIAKITEKILVVVVFIVGIVSLIEIIRTKNKGQKKRIIKETITIISIIIAIIIIISLVMWLLNKYNII